MCYNLSKPFLNDVDGELKWGVPIATNRMLEVPMLNRITLSTVMILSILTVKFVSAEVIDYQVFGVLEEGGILEGTIQLDINLIDSFSQSDRGEFEVINYDLILRNSSLLIERDRVATAFELVYIQSSEAGTQGFSIELTAPFSDELTLNVFGGFFWDGFTGDPNIAQPINTNFFSGGTLDSAGDSPFVEMDVRVVPEPGSLALLGLVGFMATRRRRGI